MKYFAFFLVLLGVVAVMVPRESAQALTTSASESVEIREPITDDLATAGTNIRVSAPVNGELFAAGSRIELTETISRSAYVAGESVTVGNVGYNLFAFGSTVTLTDTIEHDAYIAAETVIFDPETTVNGMLRIFARTVELRGTINGDVYIQAEHITSSATMNANASLTATKLTFTGGSIAENLDARTNDTIDGIDLVTVSGTTSVHDLPAPKQYDAEVWLMRLLTVFVSGAALLLLLPRKVTTINTHVLSHWSEALIWGAALTVLVPIISIPVLLTGVGTPIALVTLALYVIALYIASIIATIVIGSWVLKRLGAKHNMWGALGLGAVLMLIMSMLPIIGWAIGLAATIGVTLPVLGALFLWWRERLYAGGRV